MNPPGCEGAKDPVPVVHERVIITNASIEKPESESADSVEDPKQRYSPVNCDADFQARDVDNATHRSKLDDICANMVLLSSDCDKILGGLGKLSCLQMDNEKRVLDLVQENLNLKSDMAKQQESVNNDSVHQSALAQEARANDNGLLSFVQSNTPP